MVLMGLFHVRRFSESLFLGEGFCSGLLPVGAAVVQLSICDLTVSNDCTMTASGQCDGANPAPWYTKVNQHWCAAEDKGGSQESSSLLSTVCMQGSTGLFVAG